MKFMKLGSKPDAFHTEGNCIRYVSTDLASDVIINVGEVKFYLHKFPLLSKCNRLQKLIHKSNEENSNEICLVDFPGGPKSFEICAKFCYGMTVTLSAYNVVAARCAAEYLGMSEDIEKGNLIFKIEVFLNSTIFRTWKDSIIVLQTTKILLPWSEELKVIGRSIDSIASKTSVDPSNVTWSYTYNRKLQETPDKITEIGLKQQLNGKIDSIPPKDWWVEDICDLDIDLYRRFMVAVRSKGRMDGNMIGEALKTYLIRWLPNSVDALASESQRKRTHALIDTIICLLPSDKSACSCSFLFKLLKGAIQVGVDDSVLEDLMKRISAKLDEASVNDLLMMTPFGTTKSTKYDVELVHSLVRRFVMNDDVDDETGRNGGGGGGGGFVLGRGSILDVGKLIDDYLAEIAYDPNLLPSGFVDLSRLIPSSARPIHDGLYKAIDIYLKEHPNVTKAERKKIATLMDVKKLTAEASAHAAQNERLPLRVVVQVLFFEQVRTSSAIHSKKDSSYSEWENEGRSLRKQLSQHKISQRMEPKNDGKLMKKGSKSRESGSQLLPSRSRRIFDKIWMTVGKGGHGNGENKSSDTSGSSRSPTASMVQGEAKSFRSFSRNRRHSIS